MTNYPEAARLRDRFQFVAERAVIAAFQAALAALTLAGFDQVFQTPRAFDRRFPAFGAAAIALHAQLVFPLARDGQRREFVLYPCSHVVVLNLRIISVRFSKVHSPDLFPKEDRSSVQHLYF
jgi:hypothetical protein